MSYYCILSDSATVDRHPKFKFNVGLYILLYMILGLSSHCYCFDPANPKQIEEASSVGLRAFCSFLIFLCSYVSVSITTIIVIVMWRGKCARQQRPYGTNNCKMFKKKVLITGNIPKE